MPRKSRMDVALMSPFARWLLLRLQEQDLTVGEAAQAAHMNESYLHKILKSYLPQYQQYQRPSYEKTAQIGRAVRDVGGALQAAGYTAAEMEAATSGDAGIRPLGPAQDLSPGVFPLGTGKAMSFDESFPQHAEDWPPELIEAMHYSQTLAPEVQRYIYRLWREQARAYAAIDQSQRESEKALQVLQEQKPRESVD